MSTYIGLNYQPPAVVEKDVGVPTPTLKDVVEPRPKTETIPPSGVPIDKAPSDPINGPHGVPIEGPRPKPIGGYEDEDPTDVTENAEVRRGEDPTDVTENAEVRRGKPHDCLRWRPPVGGGPSVSWGERSR